MARQFTMEEVREQFLSRVRHLIDHWQDTCPLQGPESTHWRLEGLAHSILSILDGCSGLPKFAVLPDPSPEDQRYHYERGENWFQFHLSEPCECDIAGSLHVELLRKQPQRGPQIDRTPEDQVNQRFQDALRDLVMQVISEQLAERGE